MVHGTLTAWTGPIRIASILGPTASGKTALALALGELDLPIEVVGCDALQLYRGLEVGTAAPTAAERARLRHHLVGVFEPTEKTDAARYAELAAEAIEAIAARGRWPLLVGGTGLYHRAVVRGLADIPPVPPELRDAFAERWRRRGPAAMHAELAAVDPAYAAATPAANRQRVLRALEVHAATGKAFSAWHAEHRARPPRYEDLAVVLDPPRPEHLRRIEARAAAMAPGLLGEALAMLEAGATPDAHALEGLGYRDAVRMLRAGRPDPRALAPLLAAAHRRYAKRQRTWFRRLDPALRVDTAAPHRAVARVAARMRAHFGRRDRGRHKDEPGVDHSSAQVGGTMIFASLCSGGRRAAPSP